MDSFTTSFQGYQGKDIISLLLSFTLSFSLILALVHLFPILVFIQLVFNHWASFFINSTLWRNTVLQNKLWRKNRFPSIFVAKENNCQIYIMIFFRWKSNTKGRKEHRNHIHIYIEMTFLFRWDLQRGATVNVANFDLTYIFTDDIICMETSSRKHHIECSWVTRYPRVPSYLDADVMHRPYHISPCDYITYSCWENTLCIGKHYIYIY